jgi:signal transduction histidine kinase
MSDTRVARRPFSWLSFAAFVAELLAAGCFVIAVYELVVAGGIATLGGGWKPVLWIGAAAISGAGIRLVWLRAGALARRLLRAADPYTTLTSLLSGAAAGGPAEDALPQLARMLAGGTTAHSGTVWLAGPSGELRRASSWPVDAGPDEPPPVPDLATLDSVAGVDYVVPVGGAGEVLGALTLRARPGRDLVLPDVRHAQNVAKAAGPLLRQATLAEHLGEQALLEVAQAAELAATLHRMETARYAAREELSAEIQARVAAPLERCGQLASTTLHGLGDDGAVPEEEAAAVLTAGLAGMTAEIDAAIADFRFIVHRVYPPVLTDGGLRPALENLLADFDPRASLIPPAIRRLSVRVEECVYFCAETLLKAWDDAGAQQPMLVLAGVTTTRIQLTFEDSVAAGGERPAAPVSPLVVEQARDRVAALGGRLAVDTDESGRRLTIELPLSQEDLVTPVTRIRG